MHQRNFFCGVNRGRNKELERLDIVLSIRKVHRFDVVILSYHGGANNYFFNMRQEIVVENLGTAIDSKQGKTKNEQRTMSQDTTNAPFPSVTFYEYLPVSTSTPLSFGGYPPHGKPEA